MKHIRMLNLYNCDNQSKKKTFKILIRRIDSKTTCFGHSPKELPTVQTCHSANYFTFAYASLCMCCDTFVLFLHNLNSLFLFILRAMSVSLVSLSCLIVLFELISHLSDYVFIDHVNSRNLPLINCFNFPCFVEWVCSLSC